MVLGFSALAGSIRRRMSSNTSSIEAPSSSDMDGRRPTQEAINPQHAQTPEAAIPTELDPDFISSTSGHFNTPSRTFYPAREHQDSPDEVEEYRPFNTLEGICTELGISCPLERQGRRYIQDVGGYTGPAANTCDYFTTITEIREPPLRKAARHASIVSRHAKRWSGTLSRSASKLLRLTSAQDVVRSDERRAVDDDDEWDLSRQVDLGFEVSNVDLRSGGTNFHEVDWEGLRRS